MKKILFAIIAVLMLSCSKQEPPTLVQLTYGAIGTTDSCTYLLAEVSRTDSMIITDYLQRIRINEKGLYMISQKMLNRPCLMFNYGSGYIIDGRIVHYYPVDFDFVAKINNEFVYIIEWQTFKPCFGGLEYMEIRHSDETHTNELRLDPNEIKQYFEELAAHMMSND